MDQKSNISKESNIATTTTATVPMVEGEEEVVEPNQFLVLIRHITSIISHDFYLCSSGWSIIYGR
jgi:hypothetical protein